MRMMPPHIAINDLNNDRQKKLLLNMVGKMSQLILTKPDGDKLRTIYTKVADDSWIVVYELPEDKDNFCPCCGKHIDHYNIFDGYECNGYECIDDYTLIQRLIKYFRKYKSFGLMTAKVMIDFPVYKSISIKSKILDYIDNIIHTFHETWR